METAAVLWTGGKDSSLALHEAAREGCDIRCLVTFAPVNPEFLAHPPAFLKLQAESMELPHHLVTVEEPFERSYEAGLRRLREEMGIGTVITGDIAEVGGNPNWVRERSRPVGMRVHTPLWGRDRLALLEELLARGFRVIFSCVDTRRLGAEWVGRELDEAAIAALRGIRERNGLDLCGEEGEYHTLVTDGPAFTRAIRIRSHATRTRGTLAYMEIREMELAATAALDP